MMQKVVVQASEDRSRAEGGHASLLLRGVAKLPNRIEFELRPSDSDQGNTDDQPSWLGRRHTPLSAHLTEFGLQLTIGPELADNPDLLPGTAVEIVVAELGVHGEFLWPSITPLARPRRRSLVVPHHDHTATSAVDAKTYTLAAVHDEQSPIIAAATAMAGTAPARVSRLAEPSSVAAKQPSPIGDPAGLSHPAGHIAGETEAAGFGGERLASMLDTAGSQQFGRHVPRPKTLTGPAASPLTDAVHNVSAAVEADAGATAGDAFASSTLQSSRPIAKPVGVTAVTPASENAGSEALPALAGRVRSTGHWSLGPAILAVLGLLCAQAAVLAWYGPAILAHTAELLGAEKPTAPVAGPFAKPAPAATPLHDAIIRGEFSPRGLDPNAVPAVRMLELAKSHLEATGSNRDLDEGAFWLGRYVSTALGDEHTRRALTRLGIIEAEGRSAPPNFTAARQLWQLSASAGDPVAQCFLAKIFAHGLGVTANPAVARDWYGKAAASGQCMEATNAGTSKGN